MRTVHIPSDVYETFAPDMSAAALLNLRTELWHSLNGAAARVWEQLRKGASLYQAYAETARHYGIEPTVLEHDFEPVLEELLKMEMLKEGGREG